MRVQGVGFRAKRSRGELAFQAHRLVYHSTLGSRVIKKKKKMFRVYRQRVLGRAKQRRVSFYPLREVNTNLFNKS